MKPGQKRWSEDELILAMYLYCKVAFGKLQYTNTEVMPALY